ncbi:hypothetical protein MRB53_021119 [Persea americana]|uniref:Uncharacterized protein n=1 Tax=Persea americana TaxID=3435 RepID=A0ACC2L403_PERAE|nr:hypothetical protein MRB53_021119 [Persea americana]
MVETVESKEWFLSSYVAEGVPTSEHLKIRTVRVDVSVDSIPEGHVAIQILLLSVDPYLRSLMSGQKGGLDFTQLEIKQVVSSSGVGRIIGSKNMHYKSGDLVVSPFFPAAEYCVTDSIFLRKIDDKDSQIPLTEHLSALGMPGFTAWVGMLLIGIPKPGETVYVSAAAGAVGMYVGQLAKIKGCRVVGSTGTDEKVNLLKEEFGYDDAFNYKRETDFDAALSKYCPNGIDIYFDNVGGKMLEAVLNHVNKHARIPLCGMISQYNQVWSNREGVRNLLNLVGKEVKMEGFIVGSHNHRRGEFAAEIEGYIKQGKIKSKHQIYNGIDSFLEALASIFSSSNVGKVILQLSK